MKYTRIEGTLEEILAYERAQNSAVEHALAKPELIPPIGDPDHEPEPATDLEAVTREIVRRKFKNLERFAMAYFNKVGEAGARLELSRSSTSKDGWVDYLRFITDVGASKIAVAYIGKTQIKFALALADVDDIDNARLYRYQSTGKGQGFEAIITEPTVNDLELALELTRRAVAKVQQ